MNNKPIVVLRGDMFREKLAIAILAFGLGVPSGAYVVHATQPVVVIDPRMEAACKWPTGEAEATFVVIMEGKPKCYRWK